MKWEVLPFTSASPRAQIANDEALLRSVQPGGAGIVRWYAVDQPALVPGFAQRLHANELIDHTRALAAGLPILERQAGGGIVLLEPGMLCLAVALPLPHPLASADLTESYRWLGNALAEGARTLCIAARRVEVEDARRQATQRDRATPVETLARAACFATLSPHEVVVGEAKLIGLAQVRRRQAVLFQAGVLARDQSAIADYLHLPDEALREPVRAELRRRTVGLGQLEIDSGDATDLVRALDGHLPWGSVATVRPP